MARILGSVILVALLAAPVTAAHNAGGPLYRLSDELADEAHAVMVHADQIVGQAYELIWEDRNAADAIRRFHMRAHELLELARAVDTPGAAVVGRQALPRRVPPTWARFDQVFRALWYQADEVERYLYPSALLAPVRPDWDIKVCGVLRRLRQALTSRVVY